MKILTIIPSYDHSKFRKVKELDDLTQRQFEEVTNRSDFYDDLALSMIPKKPTPVFPSPPETPSPPGQKRKRCDICTAENGARNAKKTKETCCQCDKLVCHAHSKKICSICIQDLPL